MAEERNNYQIARKDAKNCFVESLNDCFPIGRVHFAFATYDVNRPAGQRQTNNIHIYIAVDEFLELCRKLECGELRYMLLPLTVRINVCDWKHIWLMNTAARTVGRLKNVM